MTPELRIPAFNRLTDFIGPWAMWEVAFLQQWEALQRVDWNAHLSADALKLESKLTLEPIKGGGSIATVPLTGTLSKGANSMGGTSTVQARRDIRAAAANPDVSGILLLIDSPGGTVAGTEDLAAEVKSARRSKPVFAYVEDLMASAAYWVGSQAERVFAGSQTALVGSIGTFMTIYDQSGLYAEAGVKALLFSTGAIKGAGTPGVPVSEEQQNYFQGIVAGLQEHFDSAVRQGRKLSQTQLEQVRTGAVWKASAAQELGLIDGVQSLQKTLDLLAARAADGAKAADEAPPAKAQPAVLFSPAKAVWGS